MAAGLGHGHHGLHPGQRHVSKRRAGKVQGGEEIEGRFRAGIAGDGGGAEAADQIGGDSAGHISGERAGRVGLAAALAQIGKREREGAGHAEALNDPQQREDGEIGRRSEQCGRNGEQGEAEPDSPTSVDPGAQRTDQQTGNGHADGRSIGGDADLRRRDAVIARKRRQDRLGREEVDEGEEADQADDERTAERAGRDVLIHGRGQCESGHHRLVGRGRGAPRGARRSATGSAGARGGGARRAGRSVLGLDVGREQDGGLTALVHPIMGNAVRLAGNLAGVVDDADAAGRAELGDLTAHGDDERGPPLVAMIRHNPAGLDDEAAQTQIAAVDADLAAEVDAADHVVGDHAGRSRMVGQLVRANLVGRALTGKGRAGDADGGGPDEGEAEAPDGRSDHDILLWKRAGPPGQSRK